MTYVDGFVLPVPKKNIAAYRKMATLARDVWLEYGALDYRESIADDVQPGKVTSFPQSVNLKPDETVVFAYALYKNRRDRDRIVAKVMADPRMAGQDASAMPFDGARMFWGGFETLVEMKAAGRGGTRAGVAARKPATRAARKPATRKTPARTGAKKTATRRTAAKRTPPKRTAVKRTMRGWR